MESRGIALLFFVNLGTLDGDGWSTPRPGRLYPRKDPVPIVQEAGWASEPVWIGAENLAPTGIRSPDLPAHSESLYRLSHPGSLGSYFYRFSKKKKSCWKYNTCFDFFLQLLSKTFLILRRIKRDIVINVRTSSCQVPVILVRF